MLVIGKPQVTSVDGQCLYSVDVNWLDKTDSLWFSVDECYAELLSNTCEAPLIGLLIPAMKGGHDIRVEGRVNSSLVVRLNKTVQTLLIDLIPGLKKIKISCDDEYSDGAYIRESRGGAAAGFSGGVDSYCLLSDFFMADRTSDNKINYLLFNNVGSHGKADSELFERRYNRLAPAVKAMGIPFVKVDSNLSFFYSKGIGFQQTNTIRNASVAFLIKNKIENFYYASSYMYSDLVIGRTGDMSRADPVFLSLLCSNDFRLSSEGSEYSRVEKVLKIASLDQTHDYLDVCIKARSNSSYTNCGKCWKCMRTLAILEISGDMTKYDKVFDLNEYKKLKFAYHAHVIRSKDPLVKEVKQYAKEMGYRFSLSSKVMALPFLYSLVKKFYLNF
ncbi:hypothetical protein KDX31_06490 [Amphritea atlantica]|uniref:7-cyano-7-deazaguanine synthase (Queuosine biosynthesis) n=1 Tax=Amphritea atlantica TaxID=355243 RepID=A0ABY5GXB0_9GAMM|nr:hypothetical protein KDX31_06490 [Amphritea atlantica]